MRSFRREFERGLATALACGSVFSCQAAEQISPRPSEVGPENPTSPREPSTLSNVPAQAPLQRPDFKHPFFYSTALMGVAVPIMYGIGATDAGPSVNNFERAFTSRPRWDDDTAFTNFALHPLWGSETYLRAREARFGIPGSIAFSMGMSVTWEYLFESWVSQPSTQDLIFTTGIGWTIGELRYRLKQRASDRMDWLLDPIHKTLEHFNIVLGQDSEGKLTGALGVAFEF